MFYGALLFGRTSVGESELGPASSAKTTTTGPNLVVYGQIQPAGWVVRGGIVVDEEGRGRKACPIRSCVCSSCCSGRALGFWEPDGSAINECSKVLSRHSPRAPTLARSHTRPPKEEPREEELLALTESRMERNESRRVKRVQGRYCTYRTKHKQIGNYKSGNKFCFCACNGWVTLPGQHSLGEGVSRVGQKLTTHRGC